MDVVLVPKAILKLVESVSSGPLVTMLQEKAAVEGPPVENVPPAQAGALFKPVNDAIISVFDSVEGNMNLSSTGLSVFVLSSYTRAVSASTGSSDPV